MNNKMNQCFHVIDVEDGLQGMPLAMAYVPWQEWRHVSDAGKGLQDGTIFEELVLPWIGPKAACNPAFNPKLAMKNERRSEYR